MEKSHVGYANCFFCGGPNEVLLDTRLKKTLTRNMGVLSMEPCPQCKEYMEQGIILMSISDDTSEEDMKGTIPNPHRTGGFAVITDEGLKNIMRESSILEFAFEHRFMFITDSAWNFIGLNRTKEPNDETKETRS